MIKICKRCGEKFETNNKHRGRCDDCMNDHKTPIKQPIKKFPELKCDVCGRTLDSLAGERALICSCCGQIVCFDCENKKLNKHETKHGDEFGSRKIYSIQRQQEIFEQIQNKTFKGKIQCFNCGEFFDPYKTNMHACGDVTVSGFDEEEEVIRPPHFLCENCHNNIFDEDPKFEE